VAAEKLESSASSQVDPIVVAGYDFSALGSLVDVAGGPGNLLAAILTANPRLRGVLFDLPAVIAHARSQGPLRAPALAARAELLAGDMFATIPAGQDAYLLKWILHDWSDTDTLRILSRCRQAATPGTLLLVVETIVSADRTSRTAIRESFLQAAAFVARDSELATLQGALDDMMRTCGSAWLVGGESGVGKSRLLEEVRTEALIRGAQVLRSQAKNSGGAPYQAIREILRALCLQVDLTDEQASCLLPLLPDLPTLLRRPVAEPPPLDAKATQERLLRTIEAAIARIWQPTVLLLEDIQSAAVEVILTLSHLTRRIGKLPIVLIASYRDDEAPWVPSALPTMDLLKLRRFDRATVAALSESMLGAVGRQPELVELLLRETEGHSRHFYNEPRTYSHPHPA
jgi:hypothetical protein